MRDTKLVLYDTQWQILRVQLLGKWNVQQYLMAIKMLDHYLESGSTNFLSRATRVINLINAVIMGWNGQHLPATSPMRVNIIAMRTKAQKYLEVARKRGEKAEFDLDYAKLPPAVRKSVYASLKKRWDGHPNAQTREELRYILNHIEGIV